MSGEDIWPQGHPEDLDWPSGVVSAGQWWPHGWQIISIARIKCRVSLDDYNGKCCPFEANTFVDRCEGLELECGEWQPLAVSINLMASRKTAPVNSWTEAQTTRDQFSCPFSNAKYQEAHHSRKWGASQKRSIEKEGKVGKRVLENGTEGNSRHEGEMGQEESPASKRKGEKWDQK